MEQVNGILLQSIALLRWNKRRWEVVVVGDVVKNDALRNQVVSFAFRSLSCVRIEVYGRMMVKL